MAKRLDYTASPFSAFLWAIFCGFTMTRLQPNPIKRIDPVALGGQAANPCLNCGACCAHFRVSFYCGEVAGENGGYVPVHLVRPISSLRVCMDGTESGGGRCVALRGELGQPGIHCAIYPVRPTPCREFEVWEPDGSVNADCQRLRAALGLPPVASRPDAGNDPQGPSTPLQPAAA